MVARIVGRGQKILRAEPGLDEGLAGLADDGGDVDAHGTDGRAAPAHGAGVEQQFFPFLQIGFGDARRKSQPCQRIFLAAIGLGDREEFVGRGVPGIARGFMEVAGIGALPAMHAGFQIADQMLLGVGEEVARGGFDVDLIAHHRTLICMSSAPSGSTTCTAQAMQGSKLWIVRWISSGCLGSASVWRSVSAAS